MKTVIKDTVTKLECGASPGSGDDDARESPSCCLLHLAGGGTLRARAVVIAHSHLQPIVPSWARALVKEESTTIKTWDFFDSDSSEGRTLQSNGDGFASGFSTDGINGKRVVIVGGGMTAASLALRAIKSSAKSVTLMSRRPLLCQPYDCEVGWWGNKRLNAFWNDPNPENRLKSCRQARQQGSVSPAMWATLAEAVADGALLVVESSQIESAMRQGTAWKLSIAKTAQLQDVHAPTPFQRAVALHKSSSSFDGGESNSESSPTAVETSPTSTETTDFIWLACGSAYNAHHHPLLSKLQTQCPTRIVSGYPVLDADTCVWPGAPVYLIGRGALLAVGPSAGNLSGMRLAAERIVKSLSKIEYAGVTEWATAAEKLAPRLVATPSSSGMPPPPPSGMCSVQPSSVLENYSALEEEGLMCFEQKVKPSVARPPHLVDVSDLSAALPRHEIQKFSFSEEDFEICVMMVLPEAVPLAAVRSLITEHSLEVWAIGAVGAYRLHVPRLYGRVLPSRCKVKVNEKKKKVFVVLHKEKDAEWRFLKGV